MDFSVVNGYFLKLNMRKYGAPANYAKTKNPPILVYVLRGTNDLVF